MKKTIAIQGYEGCFHQAAAREYFGNETEIISCSSFRNLVNAVHENTKCDAGVMAIENSIAGSILPNYNLLEKYPLNICGEIYLQIDQNLLVNPGVRLDDIREVHSHPMALIQCEAFLEKFPWKIVETEDTALSARDVHQSKSRHIAAIAGNLASQLFNLEVLAPNIHTEKNNYTRFWVLQRSENYHQANDANKASMVFQTDHSKGSLSRVLAKIAECDVNLSKLQSMPIPGSDWKYAFHADCEFSTTDQWERLLMHIKPCTAGIKVYGVYKNGKSATNQVATNLSTSKALIS